jgi:hypothetical protein
MRRQPAGRHTAARPRRTSPAARSRWLIALGLGCALLGAAVAVGLGRKQAVPAASAPQAAKASLTGPAVLSQYDRARRAPRHPGTGLRPAASTSAQPRTRPPAPTATPTRAPAPTPTPDPALTPTATVENQTPTGTNELAWSEAILKALGDPLTDANVESMGYWMQNEAGSPPSGIVGANNPINVSEPGYSGTPIKDEGNGYQLYSYPTVQDGIEAMVAYVNPYGYPGILAALKAGRGLSSSSLAAEFSIYSGNGYSAVPDTWGLSQGTPMTP